MDYVQEFCKAPTHESITFSKNRTLCITHFVKHPNTQDKSDVVITSANHNTKVNEAGQLSSLDGPAVKSDRITMAWHNAQGDVSRNNGPADIMIEHYEAYWVDGMFIGDSFTALYETWIVSWDTPWHKYALITSREINEWKEYAHVGRTNPTCDLYFSKAQDEVNFLGWLTRLRNRSSKS